MKTDSYLPLGLLALTMGGHFVKRWNETQIISWEVEKVQNRLNDLKRLVFLLVWGLQSTIEISFQTYNPVAFDLPYKIWSFRESFSTKYGFSRALFFGWSTWGFPLKQKGRNFEVIGCLVIGYNFTRWLQTPLVFWWTLMAFNGQTLMGFSGEKREEVGELGRNTLVPIGTFEQWENLWYFLYIGDILPIFLGVIKNHYKDPY